MRCVATALVLASEGAGGVDAQGVRSAIGEGRIRFVAGSLHSRTFATRSAAMAHSLHRGRPRRAPRAEYKAKNGLVGL
jgi:hypothetical protein